MSTELLRIWITDDEELIRKSILRILADRKDVFAVGESTSVRETVAALRTQAGSWVHRG